MKVFSKTTRDVTILVRPKYVNKESEPKENLFIWIYEIEIQNFGTDTIQVLNRHWVINDGSEDLKYVDGEGVIGRQPTIQPGEEFHYSSFCTLSNPFGAMRGKFEVINQDQETYFIEIPKFKLEFPVRVVESRASV